MAVANYVTRAELEDMLAAMEKRLLEMLATKADVRVQADRLREELKADNREQADRTIEAIQRGTSANF